jgi:serine/threonine protein kinase
LFADFGLAKDYNAGDGLNSETEGWTLKTPMYAAPEVYNHEQRSYSADIFSLGCVFMEIATLLRSCPVSAFYDFRVKEIGGVETHAYHATLDKCSSWDIWGRQDFVQLVRSMILTDPHRRPLAKGLTRSLKKLSTHAFSDLVPCQHDTTVSHSRNSSFPEDTPSNVNKADKPLTDSTIARHPTNAHNHTVVQPIIWPKTFKVTLLGDSGSGKTALAERVRHFIFHDNIQSR